ncbi:MAG: NusG domain II-containing protein [Clostridia bacterium]|nr:NusG domain II-containing protein [Clostridia bacterium]
MRNRAGLRPGDCVVGGAVVLLAVLLWLFSRGQPVGRQVEVVSPAGRTVYSLAQDRTVEIDGKDGVRVVLTIADGAVRFTESACPDQICVHSGALSRAGQSAACVPAGVAVRILGEGQVDAVAS